MPKPIEIELNLSFEVFWNLWSSWDAFTAQPESEIACLEYGSARWIRLVLHILQRYWLVATSMCTSWINKTGRTSSFSLLNGSWARNRPDLYTKGSSYLAWLNTLWIRQRLRAWSWASTSIFDPRSINSRDLWYRKYNDHDFYSWAHGYHPFMCEFGQPLTWIYNLKATGDQLSLLLVTIYHSGC